MGIHQADIVAGFKLGLEELEKFTESFKKVSVKDIRDKEEVKKFLRASISSKQ